MPLSARLAIAYHVRAWRFGRWADTHELEALVLCLLVGTVGSAVVWAVLRVFGQ